MVNRPDAISDAKCQICSKLEAWTSPRKTPIPLTSCQLSDASKINDQHST